MQDWIPFSLRKPDAGQSTLICWDSPTFHPERRVWEKENNNEDWSWMFWIPIPPHPNKK